MSKPTLTLTLTLTPTPYSLQVLPAEVVPLVQLFTNLAKDDQDSVRLQSVDNCVKLAKLMPLPGSDGAGGAGAGGEVAEGAEAGAAQTHAAPVLDVVLNTCRDASWRVR